ncbi:MAG: hypothetical protein AB1563_02400 [Bacillota bacterium]
MAEKGEFGHARGTVGAGEGEDAEFLAAVHSREELPPVLEIVQACQLLPLHQVPEEVLGGGVGGDPRGKHRAHTPGHRDKRAHDLGEDRIGVDVAPSCQGKTAAVTEELACGLRRAQCGHVFGVQLRVCPGQLANELGTPGLGGCGSDAPIPDGKKFPLLQLDTLPRRVADHRVETTGGEWGMANGEWFVGGGLPSLTIRRSQFAIRWVIRYSRFAIRKHLGKLQRPVEKALFDGQGLGARQGLWVHGFTGQGAADGIGGDDALTPGPSPRGRGEKCLEERCRPQVAGFEEPHVPWIATVAVVEFFLAANFGRRIVGDGGDRFFRPGQLGQRLLGLKRQE